MSRITEPEPPRDKAFFRSRSRTLSPFRLLLSGSYFWLETIADTTGAIKTVLAKLDKMHFNLHWAFFGSFLRHGESGQECSVQFWKECIQKCGYTIKKTISELLLCFSENFVFSANWGLGFFILYLYSINSEVCRPFRPHYGEIYGAPRFGPGTGSPQAGTLTPRPPHLRRHRIVVLG